MIHPPAEPHRQHRYCRTQMPSGLMTLQPRWDREWVDEWVSLDKAEWASRQSWRGDNGKGDMSVISYAFIPPVQVRQCIHSTLIPKDACACMCAHSDSPTDVIYRECLPEDWTMLFFPKQEDISAPKAQQGIAQCLTVRVLCLSAIKLLIYSTSYLQSLVFVSLCSYFKSRLHIHR